MNMKLVIKTGLWLMCFVCLYNILTTFDGLVFSVSGFLGLFSVSGTLAPLMTIFIFELLVSLF